MAFSRFLPFYVCVFTGMIVHGAKSGDRMSTPSFSNATTPLFQGSLKTKAQMSAAPELTQVANPPEVVSPVTASEVAKPKPEGKAPEAVVQKFNLKHPITGTEQASLTKAASANPQSPENQPMSLNLKKAVSTPPSSIS